MLMSEKPSPQKKKSVERVIIRSYPKSAFVAWILFIISIIFYGLSVTFPTWLEGLGLAFICILVFTLFVASYEFNEIKTALLFTIGALIVVLISAYAPPRAKSTIVNLTHAGIIISPNAYLAIAIGMLALLAFIWILRRFDFWIIEPNQIIHRTGILGTRERFPTRGVKYSAEIADVFEYFLFFGAGKVKINAPGVGTIVIPLVPFIRKVQKQLQEVLGYVRMKEA